MRPGAFQGRGWGEVQKYRWAQGPSPVEKGEVGVDWVKVKANRRVPVLRP